MAAYIPVPRDLTRVKSKIIFNLTKRQILCFGAAALVGFPLFFLLKETGNTSMAVICMIIVMLPFFFLGMYEKDGQPCEVVAMHFIQAKFIRPRIRPYRTENRYTRILQQKKSRTESGGTNENQRKVTKTNKINKTNKEKEAAHVQSDAAV